MTGGRLDELGDCGSFDATIKQVGLLSGSPVGEFLVNTRMG